MRVSDFTDDHFSFLEKTGSRQQSKDVERNVTNLYPSVATQCKLNPERDYVLHSLGSDAWLPRCVDVIMCGSDNHQRAANAMQSLASLRKFKNGIAHDQARHACLVYWLSRVCWARAHCDVPGPRHGRGAGRSSS